MFDVSSYRGYLRRAYGIMPEANKFAKTDEADHDIKNWRMVRRAAIAAASNSTPAAHGRPENLKKSRPKKTRQIK